MRRCQGAARQTQPAALRLAYMATGYPYPSHTFIQNEVRALRALGLDITTFVHRRATPDEILSPADRETFATTFAIRPLRPLPFLRAHLAALLTNPSGYLRAARAAVRLRGEGSRSLLWQLFYLGQAVVLWHRCRIAGLRHIHSHFANVSSDVALLATEVGGEGWSWSFTMHGPTELYDVSWFRLRQKVERAAWVVCISHFARSQLMGLVEASHWSKLQVIHCGVDTAELRSHARQTPSGDERLRIVSVGRLVPVKGQLVLLEAFAELIGAARDARLTLIGDGPMRATLERAAIELGLQHRVEICGALGHPQVIEHMTAADILCLPSFAEGVPIVLMEAMAIGLPVLTTRIMGIPELVEDGVSGVLVAPGSRDELRSALQGLIDDRDRRQALGRAAQERVVAHFDLWTAAEQLHALFTQRLADGRGATASRAPR
jgi:glycosyltransferase involved in cell wall biosynthesis